MSTTPPDSRGEREALIAAVLEAGRAQSTATVLFHGAVAARLGLGPSDSKALDLLLRSGPMTVGEIGARTGLASASVTSLIDRLEGRGFARRERDPHDRRKVIVVPVFEREQALGQLFASLGQAMTDLLQDYDAHDLARILEFLERTTEILQAEAARLPPVRGEDRGGARRS